MTAGVDLGLVVAVRRGLQRIYVDSVDSLSCEEHARIDVAALMLERLERRIKASPVKTKLRALKDPLHPRCTVIK